MTEFPWGVIVTLGLVVLGWAASVGALLGRVSRLEKDIAAEHVTHRDDREDDHRNWQAMFQALETKLDGRYDRMSTKIEKLNGPRTERMEKEIERLRDWRHQVENLKAVERAEAFLEERRKEKER